MGGKWPLLIGYQVYQEGRMLIPSDAAKGDTRATSLSRGTNANSQLLPNLNRGIAKSIKRDEC